MDTDDSLEKEGTFRFMVTRFKCLDFTRFSVQRAIYALLILFCSFTLPAFGQTNSSSVWHWVADPQERELGLPPGLERRVDTNGNVEYIDFHYSTVEYQQEALRLMLNDANWAAQALHLDEDLPITKSRASLSSIVPFGMYYSEGLLGSIATTNYAYRIMNGSRLDHIEIDQSYEVWRSLQDELLPENQLDNKGAYQLATQWLASLSVDIAALNRECELSVASSPVLNYVGSGKKPIRRMFAPTYDVTWKSSTGPAASVRLYLPDKLLIQLSIDDAKYNLQAPIIFSNLPSLFPGVSGVTTNYPVKTVEMGWPGGPTGPEVTFITDSNQPEPMFHDLRLSRWIQTQTQLNTNQLSLSQLMTLKPVSGPDEWGVVTFDLPFPYDALHSDHPPVGGTIAIGTLETNGDFNEFTFFDREKAPDGNSRINWNINWSRPGQHELRARMTYAAGMDGDQFDLIGPPLSYCASNTCRFYEDSTLFTDDGANLFAVLREPSAKFRVVVTSLKGRLVNDISSSTTNGEINLAWDLTALDGKKYTNNSFIGSFYVMYPGDAQTNPPVKAQFNKIGTSGDSN
jgi:hypothetical protein